MIELSWSDALALDLPAMDDTHREFVDLLAAVADAPDDALADAWSDLVDHTTDHFDREDGWMRQTGFASVNCHATQHAVVLSVLRDGLAAGRAGRHEVIRQLAHELALWFPQHAQTMDAALALHLRGAGFDVETGRLPAGSALATAAPITGCGSAACSTAASVPAT